MATLSLPQEAEMRIRISDTSIINDLRRLLKHINGVDSIVVSRKKSEVEMALEEAHKGQTTQWDSVDDYFKQVLNK